MLSTCFLCLSVGAEGCVYVHLLINLSRDCYYCRFCGGHENPHTFHSSHYRYVCNCLGSVTVIQFDLKGTVNCCGNVCVRTDCTIVVSFFVSHLSKPSQSCDASRIPSPLVSFMFISKRGSNHFSQ